MLVARSEGEGRSRERGEPALLLPPSPKDWLPLGRDWPPTSVTPTASMPVPMVPRLAPTMVLLLLSMLLRVCVRERALTREGGGGGGHTAGDCGDGGAGDSCPPKLPLRNLCSSVPPLPLLTPALTMGISTTARGRGAPRRPCHALRARHTRGGASAKWVIKLSPGATSGKRHWASLGGHRVCMGMGPGASPAARVLPPPHCSQRFHQARGSRNHCKV